MQANTANKINHRNKCAVKFESFQFYSTSPRGFMHASRIAQHRTASHSTQCEHTLINTFFNACIKQNIHQVSRRERRGSMTRGKVGPLYVPHCASSHNIVDQPFLANLALGRAASTSDPMIPLLNTRLSPNVFNRRLKLSICQVDRAERRGAVKRKIVQRRLGSTI